MLVGYARTSTLGQQAGLEAQERELLSAGCEKVFREQVSCVAQRTQLEAALDFCRDGDGFVVTKLDRLAWSVGDLLNIVNRLEAKKVTLRVLSMSGSQPLDASTATGRLMLAVIGAVVGQAEREGRYKGRAPTVRRRAAEIVRLKEAGVRPSEIAVRLGVGRASVYRVLAEQTDGDQQEAA